MSDEFIYAFGDALNYLGKCDKHNVIYIEVDPANKRGCPKCEKEKEAEKKTSPGP